MNTNLLDDNISGSNNSGFSARAKGFIKEIAQWGKFLAILGFIYAGIIVLGALGITGGLGNMGFYQLGFNRFFAMGMLLYLLMAVLTFIPSFFLFQFSTKAQEGLDSHNENTLGDAFENLKSNYKFNGILLIVGISFYALVFLYGLLIGMS